jgi:tetratricopeptide (TPR) repeat protein
VIQIAPKDAEAHYALGQAFESLREWEGAVGQYLATIQINSSHTDARVRLGRLFLGGNALERSLEQAEEVIKRAPQDPEGYALRGGVRARQGNSAGARQDGEIALKLEPGHVNSITLLASLYINNKEYDKALALLDEGLKRNPEQIGLRMLKAKIHVDKGETDKVLVLLEEIVQQEPSKLSHRYGLASFYASVKQLDEAENVLRDVIALAPESVEPKLALAEFLLNRRDKTLAEKELLAFIQQEPGSYPLKFGLANLL